MIRLVRKGWLLWIFQSLPAPTTSEANGPEQTVRLGTANGRSEPILQNAAVGTNW
jgi:hypothetical protein